MDCCTYVDFPFTGLNGVHFMPFDEEMIEGPYGLCERLWPINRSITGDGVRQTLGILQEHLPDLRIIEIPTGTQVFDWTIPEEWRVNDAWIKAPNGERFCEFKVNNLHLMGYSSSFKGLLSLAELDSHLTSLPEMPEAIPYVTSYYKKQWGFAISHSEREKLKEGAYEVFIDTEHFCGSLSIGELIINGHQSEEIFLSTYVCHPSMANNELSGPVVTTFLAKWISSLEQTRFSYRIIFVPETIGAIAYLSRNLKVMKERIIAGFNVTCIGDERCYSFLPSRAGDTLSDRAATHVLNHIDSGYLKYTWMERGSDERQYCAPGVDLPVATVMRSKYGEYPEYHTSLDNLDFVTESGLQGGIEVLKLAIDAIESNCYPVSTCLGEPFMSKRGLRPDLMAEFLASKNHRTLSDFLSVADGKADLIEIADLIGIPCWEAKKALDILIANDLIQCAY